MLERSASTQGAAQAAAEAGAAARMVDPARSPSCAGRARDS